MANYVKFKQGLKKDFNTTNQPLTNGMIYFVIDENNNGSIYYDTIVDGKQATKKGAVHRVKFSGLPIKITGSVIGTGVISQDGETIEINTSTNHSHGLAHQDFTVTLSNDDTNLKWTRLGNQNGEGFWLKSIKGDVKAPAWFQPNYGAGVAFGGGSTKGIISVKYNEPSVRFAGGNGDAPVWYFTITGANDKTYDLSKIGGHSSDSAKLDHNVTFKIASTANATIGGSGTTTNLSGAAVDLYLPTKISGFDLLQATRFQGNADTSTVAAKLGRGGNTSLPMTFYWDGSKGTQPTWLWGGENGTDMYIYNPSNFKVAHSVSTAGLDHNITFKISKVADATIGETGVTTKLTESAITFTIPNNLSGFSNIQSTRFQGTADNADTVDYFHVAEEKYKYETTKTQPTSGAKWCIKISTPVWNSYSETIYLTADGNNTHGTVILKTGSRQNNWWGYATNYNGTGIIGVYKLVTDSDDVYIKVDGAYTSVRIRTTFNPTISIPTTIPDYKFTSVPWQGGFFSNAIYTDTLTFTTPKYWANIPISDSLKTDTQPTFNTAYVSNWWRSTGNTGWWNETHLGGITMEDDTYVKVAGNKSFLIPKGSLKIGGNGDIFFATGYDDATLKIYGQTNTEYGTETIAIQTCFDNQDPQTSGHTTQYANRCNLLLQPRGGQVYIGKNLTAVGDTGYKLLVDGNQWTSGSQWVNGNLLFTDITGNTADTGMSLKGIYGRIGGNDGWRIAGGARANNAGYLEIATNDDMNEPIYVRQYGGGGDWNGYVSLARTFTLLDAAGRSRAPELFEAKKIHVNSLLDQNVAIADISYQFQVTGTSNFTDNVDISGITTHHSNIQMDANYSFSKPGHNVNLNQSHSMAMIRITTVDGWTPILAQKSSTGYWTLGHWDLNNFKDEWVIGFLSDTNLSGVANAKNDLTTKYRIRNVGGEKNLIFASYNTQVGSSTNPIYIKQNGEAVACSYSLSATIEAGTTNRMAYYKTANQIGSSNHYVTSSQVGINASSSKDYTFYVGGDSLFDNAVTINGNVHILPDTDVGLNAAGSLVIGNKAGQNLGIDVNEIMARNNSKASLLCLNNEGGVVQVGQDGITIQAKASSTNLQSGGLRISSENTGNSGNVALELYRGNNGSWQIANEDAILYFRTNWVGEKKTAYAKNTLIIDNTTGSASLPYLAIGQEKRNTTYGLYVVSSQSWIKNTLWTGNVYPDANNARECGTNNYFWNKMNTNWLNVNRGCYLEDGGITLYGGDINYGIIFRTTKSQGTHGYVSGDLATYFTMSNSANRGWIFKRWGVGNVASISTDGNAYFNGHIRAASTGSSWLDGQRYNYGGYNLLDATNSESYWPWLRQTNTNTKKWFSFGILSNSFYLIGSSTNRADDGYDFGWQFDISNGNTTFNTNGNKNSTSKTVINGILIVNPYYSTEQSYSEGIRVNKANNGWANIILGGDNGSFIGTSSTTWLIGHRGSNGTNSYSGSANGENLAGKINDLTIEVNSSSGQGLTLPVAQGELLTWQQRPIMAQLPAQGGSATILNNANYKTAYLATTSNGNTSMGLISANWYHVMNFRHLDNNGCNSQFVLPLNHSGQAAWRLSNGTTWKPWNYIFDDNHAMIPASNNVYNIGSTSNYWATGYINTLYIAGNAYANGSKRIPTTGNTSGTIGSATVPVYSDNGVLKTITSYSGNAATATVASSANKLNTSAGGNTNPIYFTNGVPVRSTASVGSANQPVYLNNGVITACAGSQSGTEKQQSFKISGSNGTAHWYYLGHLTSNGDNSEVIIDIYSGNGYNGAGNQNTHISIFVKDGWQSTRAAANSFGISYLVDHSDVNATSIRVKGLASADNIIDLYVYLPWGYSDGYYSIKGYYNTWAHKGTRSTAEPTSGEVQNCVFGAFRAGQVYGAVWNDYAEYRQTKKHIQPGYCVIETGKGDLIKSSERLQPGANIVSDTFGFAIGETEQTKTPLAVSGRVLAYPYEDRDSYQAGDPVCSGPNGTISKMTREEVREYPERIIGTVSEIPDYEVWGTGNVKVNNRIWIKVK